MEKKEGQCDEKSEELRKYNWKKRSNLIYKINISVLYHLKRERFLQRLDRNISACTLIFATAAVTVVIKKYSDEVSLIITAITATLSLLRLVFDFSGGARLHQTLANEFRKLLSDCESSGEYWETGDRNKFYSKFVDISSKEPAAFNLLVIDCQNQIALAKGDPVIKIPFMKRLLMNFFDFDIVEFSKESKRG